MASNKIKFEMTLEKLAFKFEGDYEQGQKIQTGISRALGDIASLQSNAMGAKSPALIDVSTSSAPSRRKRKKRAQNGESEGDASVVENGAESDGEQSERRSAGESPTLLLTNLKKSGFFQEGKTAAQILNHLGTKGHTSVRGSDLTSPLLKLCQRDILTRSKPDDKTWHYANGSKDE